MKPQITLLFILLSLGLLAQEETSADLITDRPDQTESSSVVPLRSLQVETGFMLENKETNTFKKQSFAYNTTLLRYGLLENFELRVGLEYLGEELLLKNTNFNSSHSGLSPIYTGFKVKITEEDAWKPEVAFLGGLVLPFPADKSFKPLYTAANLRFAVSHTLSDRISLGYNLGAEWDGQTALPRYFYSVALGVGVTDKLGAFVESYGLIAENGNAEHLVDAGFTFLILPNFQFDVSGGIGLNDDAIDNFVSVGLTYRLPN